MATRTKKGNREQKGSCLLGEVWETGREGGEREERVEENQLQQIRSGKGTAATADGRSSSRNSTNSELSVWGSHINFQVIYEKMATSSNRDDFFQTTSVMDPINPFPTLNVLTSAF